MDETDSTGAVVGGSAPPEDDPRDSLGAAQREAARSVPRLDDEDDDAPAPGSWRERFATWQSDVVTIEWDGEEYEIAAEMPQSYIDATNANDVRGMIRAIIGDDGYRRLRIPADFPAEELLDMLKDLDHKAGRVWGTGNFNRSARRSKGTTRR